MEFTPQELNLLSDLLHEREMAKLRERNKQLRELIAEAEKTYNYRPKNGTGQGTSPGCGGESA
jgi:hypothetical protein